MKHCSASSTRFLGELSPTRCVWRGGHIMRKRSAGAVSANFKIWLFGAAVFLGLGRISARSSNSSESCARLTDAVFSTNPCDQTFFAFTMEGETSTEDNTINFAAVVDGSASMPPEHGEKEKSFTKNAVAACAERNLFENGGTVSYVQFGWCAKGEGTFISVDEFNEYVDADVQSDEGTSIGSGISAARLRLNTNPSSANFMIVITDGNTTHGGYPGESAGLAMDEGTIIFAVGLGAFINREMLQDIAGTPDRAFDIDNFDELGLVLDDILSKSEISGAPCNATGVELNVEFNVPITSVATSTSATEIGSEAGATISGNAAEFVAKALEDNPTQFQTWLDTCGLLDNTASDVVLSISYSDDQNRNVDVASELEGMGLFDNVVFYPFEVLGTPSGTTASTWFSVAATIAFGSALIAGGGAVGTSAGGSVVATLAGRGVEATTAGSGGGGGNGRDGGGKGEHGGGKSGDGGGMQRRPSAMLGTILIKQLQFIAMLSRVEHIVARESWFANFATGLRWMHLWRPAEEMEDLVFNECTYSNEASNVSALVFIGNFESIVGLLPGISMIHVIVVSGIEAYWLTKKTAAVEVAAVLGRDASMVQVEAHLRETRAIPEAGEKSHLGPVATCRELSPSAYLCFPHIELMFLFYAFEGAVASHIAVMAKAGCPEMVCIAATALALYPVLKFVTVWRTIQVRILPDDLIVFKFYENGARPGSGDTCFFGLFKNGKGRSLLSWAEKGEWTTVPTPDLKLDRERNWFKIGFKPIFADYTKSGTWFVMVLLVEAVGTACVCVLTEDSAVQLGLLFGIQLVLLVIIVWQNPHANRVTTVIHAFLVFVNVVTAGLEAISALRWEGAQEAQSINSSVAGIQVVALSAVTILVCMDTATLVVLAMWEGVRKRVKDAPDEAKAEPEVQALINAYTRRKWFGAWCTMIRHNTVACVRDTRKGLRRPQAPAIGPPVAYSESEVDVAEFFWTKEDFSRTVDAPSSSTLAEEKNAAGSMASIWGVLGAPSGQIPFDETMLARSRELPADSEAAAGDRSDRYNPSGGDQNGGEETTPMLLVGGGGKLSMERRAPLFTALRRRSPVRSVSTAVRERSHGSAVRAFADAEG